MPKSKDPSVLRASSTCKAGGESDCRQGEGRKRAAAQRETEGSKRRGVARLLPPRGERRRALLLLRRRRGDEQHRLQAVVVEDPSPARGVAVRPGGRRRRRGERRGHGVDEAVLDGPPERRRRRRDAGERLDQGLGEARGEERVEEAGGEGLPEGGHVGAEGAGARDGLGARLLLAAAGEGVGDGGGKGREQRREPRAAVERPGELPDREERRPALLVLPLERRGEVLPDLREVRQHEAVRAEGGEAREEAHHRRADEALAVRRVLEHRLGEVAVAREHELARVAHELAWGEAIKGQGSPSSCNGGPPAGRCGRRRPSAALSPPPPTAGAIFAGQPHGAPHATRLPWMRSMRTVSGFSIFSSRPRPTWHSSYSW